MCIGREGTGVGSPIRGHARRGGSKLRDDHRQHGVVALTNEYRTSQTCAYCLGPVTRPKATVIRNGRKVQKSTNGASNCMNISCPLYRTGRTTQNRDVQAALCIALAGASFLLTGKTLHPFFKNSAALRQLNPNPTPHTGISQAKELARRGLTELICFRSRC